MNPANMRNMRSSNDPRMQSQIIHPPLSIINSRAFTLIELLVVIAVIAVLMAVLLPAFSRVRKHTKSVVCRSHLKQWGMAMALYLEDNEGRFPRVGANENGVQGTLSLLRGIHVGSQIDPNAPGRYHGVRTEGIACCPMANKGNGPGSFTTVSSDVLWMEGKLGATFAPWEITRPGPPFRMSYGLNNHVFSHSFDGPGVLGTFSLYTDIFSLKRRDGIPLLLDAVSPTVSLPFESVPPPPREPSGSAGEICINRHEGTLNSLFLDWSVRSVGLKELWTLKWHLQWDTRGRWTKAGNVQPEDWPEWMRGFKDY